jgi:hypothetical protein
MCAHYFEWVWHKVCQQCVHHSSWRMMSNFSSLLTIFWWFFTWSALSDVALHFSLNVDKKSWCSWRRNWMSWVNHHHNQSIHVTAYRDVTLCESPTGDKCSHRLSMPNCVKPKILRKFKKWYNFEVTLKWNRAKRNCIKQDLPVFLPSLWLLC